MDNATIQAYINSHEVLIKSILAGAAEQIYNMIGIDVQLSVAPAVAAKKETGIDEVITTAAKKLCLVWGVTIYDVFNGTRKRELVTMRQIVFYYIRKTYPSISLTSIGEHLGGYDHATIIRSIKLAKE